MLDQEKLENANSLEELNAEIARQMKEREKAFWKNNVDEKRKLVDALTLLMKNELDDIRVNLCVHGISKLKKQEMAQALVNPILDFSTSWFENIISSQYDILSDIAKNGGASANIDMEDTRLDYIRSLGILHTGRIKGENVWYMSDEILKVWNQLDTEFLSRVKANEEVVRLVSGLLTQYGFLTYDILFERVQKIAKIAEFDFKKFMGILINASCWQENILISEAGMIHYGVLDEDALEYEREKNANLTYKEFSYDETFKAGAVNYVSENNAYQQLIALMQVNFELDFKEANDIADELCIMLQNGDDMNEMLSYFQVALKVPTKLVTEELLKVFVEMKNTIGLWRLKGYSIKELGTVPLDCVENYRIVETKADGMRFVPAKASVGRNDPCPCGSGKKYKKCCLQ